MESGLAFAEEVFLVASPDLQILVEQFAAECDAARMKFSTFKI